MPHSCRCASVSHILLPHFVALLHHPPCLLRANRPACCFTFSSSATITTPSLFTLSSTTTCLLATSYSFTTAYTPAPTSLFLRCTLLSFLENAQKLPPRLEGLLLATLLCTYDQTCTSAVTRHCFRVDIAVYSCVSPCKTSSTLTWFLFQLGISNFLVCSTVVLYFWECELLVLIPAITYVAFRLDCPTCYCVALLSLLHLLPLSVYNLSGLLIRFTVSWEYELSDLIPCITSTVDWPESLLLCHLDVVVLLSLFAPFDFILPLALCWFAHYPGSWAPTSVFFVTCCWSLPVCFLVMFVGPFPVRSSSCCIAHCSTSSFSHSAQ